MTVIIKVRKSALNWRAFLIALVGYFFSLSFPLISLFLSLYLNELFIHSFHYSLIVPMTSFFLISFFLSIFFPSFSLFFILCLFRFPWPLFFLTFCSFYFLFISWLYFTECYFKISFPLFIMLIVIKPALSFAFFYILLEYSINRLEVCSKLKNKGCH